MKKISRRNRIIIGSILGVLVVMSLYVSTFFTGEPDYVRPGASLTMVAGDEQRLCTAAATVAAGEKVFAVTAGHCAPPGTTVFENTGGYRGKIPLGKIVYSSIYSSQGENMDGDWALIDITRSYGSPAGSGFHSYPVSTMDPTRGQAACKIGSKTDITCGSVIDPEPSTVVNVAYTDGSKAGMFPSVKLCAEPGDSGGPIIVDNTVIGVLSSIDERSSSCNNSTIYYTPMSLIVEKAKPIVGGELSIVKEVR